MAALLAGDSRSIRPHMLPSFRDIGCLRLDLLARDGYVRARPLGLHPREFALIWRLADCPGVAVDKKALIRDVWRMAHVPDTNSLAVHVFRLRAKLAIAGLAGLIGSAPSGGYYLDHAEPPSVPAYFLLAEADGQEAAAMALSTQQTIPWEP